jgi:hypothetical protein
MVKIGFKLQRDQDDYPPADWEWLWAKRVNVNTYKLDNVPFFAKGVGLGDIIAAKTTQEGLVFASLIEPSGHSTLRVVVLRGNLTEQEVQRLVEDFRETLRGMGCSTELSHIPNLFSVDVPPGVSYHLVTMFLSLKEEEGLVEYEEACVA